MIRVLITFLILLLFLPIFIVMMITGIVLSYIMHPRYFYWSMHLGCKLLLFGGWQYHTIHGQVPPKSKGPYLFMFNHESMFDAFMLGASIPYYINAIGWEGIFKWPLWGFFATRYGAYQITHDNTDQAKATLKVADKILLIARTRPIEQCEKPSDGLSLFFTDLDRSAIEVREIEKMGRKAVDSNELFINELRVPFEDRIGEEGKGFQYLLHGLNPERILIAAEAIGVGRVALARASQYAKDRRIFGRPIGQNQSIQHPLAQSWCELEAANLMCFKAAALYDQGKPCGIEANASKFLSARAGFDACERSMLTHGGYGYAKEFHVERFMREQWIYRIAPVTEQLMLCYIAERELGLPKSY